MGDVLAPRGFHENKFGWFTGESKRGSLNQSKFATDQIYRRKVHIRAHDVYRPVGTTEVHRRTKAADHLGKLEGRKAAASARARAAADAGNAAVVNRIAGARGARRRARRRIGDDEDINVEDDAPRAAAHPQGAARKAVSASAKRSGISAGSYKKRRRGKKG
jgi:hypothetical protein